MIRGPQELWTYLFALSHVQGLKEIYLCPHQINYRSIATQRASWVSTQSLTSDLVTLFTQKIEDRISSKKAGAIFINLTAAYNTVWHRGLTCKLFGLLLDRHMASLILKLVCNRSFTLASSTGTQIRLRRLKNGVPQGYVLASFLFNIHMYNLPVTVTRRFAYADDLDILHYASNGQVLKRILTLDMETLSS